METLKKINNKNYLIRYATLIIILFISAVNYNVFVLPSKLVLGGTGGIAVITKILFDIDPSIIIFILSAFLLLISFIFLGFEDTIAATVITIVYPLFIKLTSNIGMVFHFNINSTLLVSIVAACFIGFTNGIIYRIGFNTGGLGILFKVINQKFKISISLINLICNSIIVIIGGFIFGFNMVLYALLTLYISKNISETILVGNTMNKMFYIISVKHSDIEKYIIEELHHDVTIFKVKGKFCLKESKAIMTVIPTFEYTKLKEKIKKIDKNAFVIISESYEVKKQDIKINSVNKLIKSD